MAQDPIFLLVRKFQECRLLEVGGLVSSETGHDSGHKSLITTSTKKKKKKKAKQFGVPEFLAILLEISLAPFPEMSICKLSYSHSGTECSTAFELGVSEDTPPHLISAPHLYHCFLAMLIQITPEIRDLLLY